MQRIAFCSQAQNFCSQTRARSTTGRIFMRIAPTSPHSLWKSSVQTWIHFLLANHLLKRQLKTMAAFLWQQKLWKSFPVLQRTGWNEMICLNEINIITSSDKSPSLCGNQLLLSFPTPHSEPQGAGLHVVQCLVDTWDKPGGFQTWRDVLSTPGAGASTLWNLLELSLLTHGNPPDIQTLARKTHDLFTSQFLAWVPNSIPRQLNFNRAVNIMHRALLLS